MLSCSVVSDSLDPMDCSLPGSSVHGDSPGKNIRVSCHALLQGIFPPQGSNSGLPHCRWFFTIWATREAEEYEWVTYPFSKRSSQPRNQTGFSCIAGGFFTSWTTRKVLKCIYPRTMIQLLSFCIKYLWSSYILHCKGIYQNQVWNFWLWYRRIGKIFTPWYGITMVPLLQGR